MIGSPDSITRAAIPERERRAPVVLQVLPGLVAGGAERSTIDIAGAVVAAGGTALVASSGGRLEGELGRAGATHVHMPADSKNPWVLARNVSRLAGLIDRHAVEIVHARSRAVAWSAWAAARRTGRRFVTTFHGTYNFNNPVKRRYNAIMTHGERVIANSRFIADHIQANYRVDPAVIRIIPRGIDLARFDPAATGADRVRRLAQIWRVPDGAPVVLLPGRLTRWKGQSVLIDALAVLGRRDLACVLVGAEPGRDGYRRELEAQADRHGLANMVRIADHCDDMPAALMLADAVVSASTDPEAFGRVAVEAQAMGRPTVASAHGGACETVIAGETGWLVPPGDPAALAQALAQALALGAEARRGLARRAIAHVRANYGRDLMCARTLAVYRELLPGAVAGR